MPHTLTAMCVGAYKVGQKQFYTTRTSTRITTSREGAPSTASAPGYVPGENHLFYRSLNVKG